MCYPVIVANGDVAKAAAVTDAVARELDCMRKDVGSINLYCNDCEKKSKPREYLVEDAPVRELDVLLCSSTSVGCCGTLGHTATSAAVVPDRPCLLLRSSLRVEAEEVALAAAVPTLAS